MRTIKDVDAIVRVHLFEHMSEFDHFWEVEVGVADCQEIRESKSVFGARVDGKAGAVGNHSRDAGLAE